MGTRKAKLAVLALFCAVAIGSSTRVLAQNQDQVGEWGEILEWPLMAVHMILLKNGKVLCLYDEFDTNPNRFMVFDPAGDATCSTQLITDRPIVPESNPPEPILLFCTGHNQLPDGKIVFVGGGFQYVSAHNHTVIFDPDKPLCAPWSVEDDMPDVAVPGGDPVKGKRWYPSVTKLADGTVLVVAGQKESTLPHTADVPLVFDSKKPKLQQYTELFAAEQYLPYYPFNFQLSSGGILYAGADSEFIADHSGGESYSQVLIPTTGEAWGNVAGVPDPILGGSAVMYGPDKFMKGGGYEVVGGGLQHWSDKIYKLDMGDLNPMWEAVDFLDNPRKDFYLLALPGGKILAIGGDAVGGPGDTLIPELLEDPDNPAAVWMPMAPMTTTVDRCGVSQQECQSDADCGNCATEACTVIADCAIGELCI